MLVIKDLYSDISDCFWLFYGSKYIPQMKAIHALLSFVIFIKFIDVTIAMQIQNLLHFTGSRTITCL